MGRGSSANGGRWSAGTGRGRACRAASGNRVPSGGVAEAGTGARRCRGGPRTTPLLPRMREGEEVGARRAVPSLRAPAGDVRTCGPVPHLPGAAAAARETMLGAWARTLAPHLLEVVTRAGVEDAFERARAAVAWHLRVTVEDNTVERITSPGGPRQRQHADRGGQRACAGRPRVAGGQGGRGRPLGPETTSLARFFAQGVRQVAEDAHLFHPRVRTVVHVGDVEIVDILGSRHFQPHLWGGGQGRVGRQQPPDHGVGQQADRPAAEQRVPAPAGRGPRRQAQAAGGTLPGSRVSHRAPRGSPATAPRSSTHLGIPFGPLTNRVAGVRLAPSQPCLGPNTPGITGGDAVGSAIP